MTNPNSVRFEANASVDPYTGRISLGAPEKDIYPKSKDFEIPKAYSPHAAVDGVREDYAQRVRNGLFMLTQADAEMGESLAMAQYLQKLKAEQRETLYRELERAGTISTNTFQWLLCIRPEDETEIIGKMQELLDAKERNSEAYRKKRRELGTLLTKSVNSYVKNFVTRWQDRNNRRYRRQQERNREKA